MDLIEELRLKNPNRERLLDLIADENLNYVATRYGKTPLMYAFTNYGIKLNCDSSVFHKILDMGCKPDYINQDHYTALMHAFKYYGKNPNCDSSVLHKLLDLNCMPEIVHMYEFFNNGITIIDECAYGNTALMYALKYYGKNPNCDHSVLLKLLNMNCNPSNINYTGEKALMYAFEYYSTNPNYDPQVFIKLISLSHSPITKSKLIALLNSNTKDHKLKSKILGAYNYNYIRSTLIKDRILRRYKLNKNDSKIYFN
jgi:hypothetical protein